MEGIVTVVSPNTCGFRVSLSFSALLAPISNATHACWECRSQVPVGRSLCDLFYAKAASERGGMDQQLKSLVERVIKESLKEIETSQAH